MLAPFSWRLAVFRCPEHDGMEENSLLYKPHSGKWLLTIPHIPTLIPSSLCQLSFFANKLRSKHEKPHSEVGRGIPLLKHLGKS